MTERVYFKHKKLLIFAMQTLGDLGLMGARVKISGRKCHIWNRQP